jgi:hypothetical protein
MCSHVHSEGGLAPPSRSAAWQAAARRLYLRDAARPRSRQVCISRIYTDPTDLLTRKARGHHRRCTVAERRSTTRHCRDSPGELVRGAEGQRTVMTTESSSACHECSIPGPHVT